MRISRAEVRLFGALMILSEFQDSELSSATMTDVRSV